MGSASRLYDQLAELPPELLPVDANLDILIEAIETLNSAGDLLNDACWPWLDGKADRGELVKALAAALDLLIGAARVVADGPVTSAERRLAELDVQLDTITNALA